MQSSVFVGVRKSTEQRRDICSNMQSLVRSTGEIPHRKPDGPISIFLQKEKL